MHIVVMAGSAHSKGTSVLLAEQFINGATETGHGVVRFDAAFAKVHPCIGCDHCECGKKDCVFQDDMAALYPKLKEAYLVVFVTPLYYHAMSAQLKAAVDRFHGVDNFLCGAEKKAVLLVSAADMRTWIMDGVKASYEANLKYLGWANAGQVLAYGCYHLEDLLKIDYPRQAYELGRRL